MNTGTQQETPVFTGVHDQSNTVEGASEPLVVPSGASQSPLRGIANPNFGDGWLSPNAADLIRIVVYLGNYDEVDLVRRVAMTGGHGTTNTRTVERVLSEMLTEDRATRS